MSLQYLGKERTYSEYSDGKAPELENEIAFSKAIMKENSWQIYGINIEKSRFFQNGQFSIFFKYNWISL